MTAFFIIKYSFLSYPINKKIFFFIQSTKKGNSKLKNLKSYFKIKNNLNLYSFINYLIFKKNLNYPSFLLLIFFN